MLQYAVAPRGEDMEKFNRALRGYDPEEVNAFLDQVITQVEKMIAEGKEKDKKIYEDVLIVNACLRVSNRQDV